MRKMILMLIAGSILMAFTFADSMPVVSEEVKEVRGYHRRSGEISFQVKKFLLNSS